MTKRTSKPVRWVGQGLPRVDADGKVRGTTRYLNDVEYKGILHGVVVRSPVPRGILKALVPDPAFDWSQIVLATAQDVPGENVVVMHDRTMPLIARSAAKSATAANRSPSWPPRPPNWPPKPPSASAWRSRSCPRC